MYIYISQGIGQVWQKSFMTARRKIILPKSETNIAKNMFSGLCYTSKYVEDTMHRRVSLEQTARMN